MLPLKEFQCGLIDDGPFSSSQGRPLSASSFYRLSLSRPGDQWCDVPVFVPQHFRSSEMQATCDGCFAPPVYLLCHFFGLRHVQDSTPTGFLEGGCRTMTQNNMCCRIFFTQVEWDLIRDWWWFDVCRRSDVGGGSMSAGGLMLVVWSDAGGVV